MAKHQFQAQMAELLHLMTHSLYSNKDIFLRELTSNANDALDKFNFLHLSDERFKDEEWQGKIIVKVDDKDNSLSVIDNGIGMNEQDLIENLGTIASSGTKAFLEKLSGDAKKDSNLIGQFGVGFYSVFMVAEHVDVITKKAGEEQAYKFSTDGKGEYEIKPVIKESHGTVVYIKLKDDAKEYLNPTRIREIIRRYSNHIAYAIIMKYDTIEYEGEGESRKEKRVVKSEQVNAAKALWTLPKNELKKEDYIEFYKTLAHDEEEPLTYIHNQIEGTLNYTTLFYIPRTAPVDMYRADYKPGLKLYVKRVFITDENKELLPVYLRFIKGIIDSEDLPLNVSREMLQENRILATIRQYSIKKILEMIKKLEGEDAKRFSEQYNSVMKEGAYVDAPNKEKILEIVHFKSTMSDGMITLDEYISRADSEKKEICYIIGDDAATLKESPLVEAYKCANIEVLLCDDRQIDEIVMPMLGEYKGWRFVDIATANAPKTLNDEELKALEKEYEPLLKLFKDVLQDEVKDVTFSARLESSPACLVKDPNDPMAALAPMLRQMGQEVGEVPLVLELNPKHPIIQKLKDKNKDEVEQVAELLYESTAISEGIEIKNKSELAKQVWQLLEKAL